MNSIKLFIITSLALISINSEPAAADNDVRSIYDVTFPVSEESKRLMLTVKEEPSADASLFNADNFLFRANTALNFMSPGSRVTDLKVRNITGWSSGISSVFREYLYSLHEDEQDKPEPGAIEKVISEFENGGHTAAILSWKITDGSRIKEISSMCIINSKGEMVFDTELIHFTTGISVEAPVITDDNGSPSATDAIVNQRSGLITYSYWVHGTFGSVRHYNEVRATGIVSPYITAATNDAEFNAYTTTIISDRRNIDPLAPSTTPCIYFGEGGSVGNNYSGAVPFNSPVNLTHANDKFNTGVYNVSVDNGSSISFSVDFQVSAGPLGLGITPVSNNPDITLSSSGFTNVSMNHFLYYYLLGNTYRLLYYDGGSLNLSDFRILTGEAAGETGSINVKLPMQVAYWSYLVLYTYSDINVNLNLNNLQYVRGDHLKQPSFTLTSNKSNLEINEIDTLKFRIKNNSSAVTLKGGNVSVDVSSLNNKLTLLSGGTLSIDSVTTGATKEYKFVVRGNENGIVTPQVIVSSMKWGYPVPPDVIINNVVSIDTNIDVSPHLKTLTLKAPLQGFYDQSSNTQSPDTLRLCLRHSAPPYSIADSTKALINSGSTGDFIFTKAVNYVNYYIELKHRNSIDTWSMNPVQFVNSFCNYDFSTSIAQAYGNNLVKADSLPVTYSVYGGDIVRDGFVNLSDIMQVYNNSASYLTGYVQSDVTGDLIVNLKDILLTYNNSVMFVSRIAP